MKIGVEKILAALSSDEQLEEDGEPGQWPQK
jgi:hypothetical protein